MARVGFDYATLETEFASDPKFKRLQRGSNGNPIAYHAAVGAWLQIVADTWHAADRFAGTESASDLPPELVEMLRRADLLDDASCISESAFDQWIGRALLRRKDVAERVRRHRERKASVTRTGTGNAVVTLREGDSEGEGSSSRKKKENGRDEVSVERAWLSTLRDLYGPGGVFEGRPLPGKFAGKTWADIEAGGLA